jgi:hypothetical protein
MALDELVRRRPGTLLDLYLELKKAGPERLARFEGLPAGGWEHLLGALLAARRVAAGENLAELIAAIDRHARDAQDREHYHRTILVHLLGDRMIDPGAVAAESVPDRSGEAAPEASASRHTGDGQRHGQVRGDNLAELRRFLDSSARVEGPEAIQLVRLFEKMWVHQPALLVRWIEPVLSTRAGVDRLIGLLPDRILTRLLQRMRPSEHVELETAADLVVQLWRTADPVQSRGRLRSVRWRGIFDFVFVEGRRFSLSGFVDAFVGRLAEASGSSDLERFRRSLIDRIVVPDPAASLTLAVARVMGATDLPEPAAHAPVSSEPDIGQDDRPSGERIAVENAGLVIASPYLPTLFKRLGLTEGARFSNPEAAGRATHLLQYMVNRSTKTSEHELVLNKILCGVPTERPVDSGIEIRDTEVELIDGLILAMIEHWSKIGKTSVDGFRESFLQRRGVLVLKDPGWVLEVEERSYDVLLDSIPWSFSIVRHSWMERAIHVKWRSA